LQNINVPQQHSVYALLGNQPAYLPFLARWLPYKKSCLIRIQIRKVKEMKTSGTNTKPERCKLSLFSNITLKKEKKMNRTLIILTTMLTILLFATPLFASGNHSRNLVSATEFDFNYTSIIIDASELKASRAAFPKIMYPDEKVLYGRWKALKKDDLDFLLGYGIVAYSFTIEEALANERAGENPLVVEADSLSGPGNWDIVLSEAIADKVRLAALENDLFRSFKVVIVTGGVSSKFKRSHMVCKSKKSD
jgi:hypothetical protein